MTEDLDAEWDNAETTNLDLDENENQEKITTKLSRRKRRELKRKLTNDDTHISKLK